MEKEFFPEFFAQDLVNLAKRNIYLKLIVDGVAGRPFSAKTLDAFPEPPTSYQEEIINFSREKYTSSRHEIEEAIARWTGNFVLKNKPARNSSEIVLYDAKCQECGKWTKVPFKPEPGKTLFCKACLKKMENDLAQNRPPRSFPQNSSASRPPLPEKAENHTVSLEELLLKKPVAFSKSRSKSSSRDKKSVDKEALKQALRESLANDFPLTDKAPGQKRPQMSGPIEPGEKIIF